MPRNGRNEPMKDSRSSTNPEERKFNNKDHIKVQCRVLETKRTILKSIQINKKKCFTFTSNDTIMTVAGLLIVTMENSMEFF